MNYKVNNLFSNFLVLGSGTVISQLILFLSSPLFSRIYTPYDFGNFTLFSSYASAIALLSSGRFEQAIVPVKSSAEANGLKDLSILINFSTTLLFLLIGSGLVFLIDFPKYYLALPISIFFINSINILTFWNLRIQSNTIITKGKIYGSLSNVFISLIVGFTSVLPNGLILGLVFGQATNLTLLTKKLKGPFQSFTKMRVVFRRNLDFFMINFPTAVFDTIRILTIPIIITEQFNVEQLGQFGLAWKVIYAPIATIGGSLSQAFLQRISILKKEKLNLYTIKIIKPVLIITITTILLYHLFGPSMFIWIFGKQWYVSAKISVYLFAWMGMNLITSILSNLLLVLRKLKTQLFFTIGYTLIPVLVLFSKYSNDFTEYLFFLSYTNVFYLLIYSLVILTILKTKNEIN